MGLFINHQDHPEVFKNQAVNNESNQWFDHTDELTEMIRETNKSYMQKVNGIQVLLKSLDRKQKRNTNKLISDFGEVKQRQDLFETHVNRWLIKMDEENQHLQLLLENNILDKLSIIEQFNQNMLKGLEEIDIDHREMQQTQSQMTEQLSLYNHSQNQLVERLDHHEALIEKITRQMDYFRSILFERTNFITEQIENNYEKTTSYFFQLFNGQEGNILRLTEENEKVLK